MIQKTLLLSLLLLLNSCSLETLLALGEVDKVEVVKQNASVSQYRAYFQRSYLETIKNKRKYLYFYNKKKKDLAILFRYHTHYTLYSLFQPKAPKITIRIFKKVPYYRIAKALKKKGYIEISNPRKIGASARVALRRFKGIKTLMVEVKKYHKVTTKSKKTQKNTKQAKSIIVPKALDTKDDLKEKEVNLALAEEKPEIYTPTATVTSYNYYAQESSYKELKQYLSNEETKSTLSFNQYQHLKQRLSKLKEEKILKEGSLEELISSYKINKDKRYKSRILELMKEVQK